MANIKALASMAYSMWDNADYTDEALFEQIVEAVLKEAATPSSLETDKTRIKPECLKCPCFQVRNCFECEHFTAVKGGALNGSGLCDEYPPYCDPYDCLAAREELTRLRQEKIFELVKAELESAVQRYEPMRSAHEGYATILEELDELWNEVKQRTPDSTRLRKEAIQVATMAIRFVLDLVPPAVFDEEGSA